MFVRQAKPSDTQAIARIHVSAWRHAYAKLLPREFLLGLDVGEKALGFERALRESGARSFLVAERDARVVGFSVHGASRDEDADPRTVGELMAIYVAPEFSRLGAGRCLITEVLRDARRRDWRSLTLWTLAENLAARTFYRNMGFQCDNRERRDDRLIGILLHEIRYRWPG